jgi:hypothetical protein
LNFLDEVLTSPVRELTGILADKVKFWRFQNQVNTALKAQEFLRAKGIKPRKFRVKDLSNLLEFTSFEEDDAMQGRWAALLAHAADPNNEFDMCSVFAQILNQLSPHEVGILDYMFKQSFWKSDRDRPYLKRREIVGQCFVKYRVSLLLFDNLLRLRLVESDFDQITAIVDSFPPHGVQEPLEVRLSEFGAEFVRQS